MKQVGCSGKEPAVVLAAWLTTLRCVAGLATLNLVGQSFILVRNLDERRAN